jgi:hypothetical protein
VRNAMKHAYETCCEAYCEACYGGISKLLDEADTQWSTT